MRGEPCLSGLGHPGATRARSSVWQGVVAWSRRAGRYEDPGELGTTGDLTEWRGGAPSQGESRPSRSTVTLSALSLLWAGSPHDRRLHLLFLPSYNYPSFSKSGQEAVLGGNSPGSADWTTSEELQG